METRIVSLRLPEELLEKARDYAYWTPGMTLTTCIKQALEKHIEDIESDRGEPIPVRTGKLKLGRDSND